MKIIFNIYEFRDDLKAEAFIENDKCVKIKLLFKCERGYYYHFLNDAGNTFEANYPQYN